MSDTGPEQKDAGETSEILYVWAQCDHVIMGQEDKSLVVILNGLMMAPCTLVLNKITAMS